MRVNELQKENPSKPLLRVYYGPEPNRAKDAIDVDRDASPPLTNVEIEDFWAGRIPAFRFSARIAA